jgi:hypothetical protein
MPPGELPEPRRFVGIGIDAYDHFDRLDVACDVQAIGDLLIGWGYAAALLTEDVTDAAAEAGLKAHLPHGELKSGALVVLWAGHAEPSATRELRLITRDAQPNSSVTRSARQLAEMALRTRQARS